MWHKHAGMVFNPRLQHRYGFECMERFFFPSSDDREESQKKDKLCGTKAPVRGLLRPESEWKKHRKSDPFHPLIR